MNVPALVFSFGVILGNFVMNIIFGRTWDFVIFQSLLAGVITYLLIIAVALPTNTFICLNKKYKEDILKIKKETDRLSAQIKKNN